MKNDFMKRAIEAAIEAKEQGEVPVGAVIVRNGEIIAVGRNRREKEKSSLKHAETDAIEQACKVKGDWRLDDCSIYVTMEPCPMCAGAIYMSRIKELVFGAYSPQGAVVSKIRLFDEYDSDISIAGGVMLEECENLIKDFV